MDIRKIAVYAVSAFFFMVAGLLIGMCLFYKGNVNFMPVYVMIAVCGSAGAMTLVFIDAYVQTQTAGSVQTKLVRVK